MSFFLEHLYDKCLEFIVRQFRILHGLDHFLLFLVVLFGSLHMELFNIWSGHLILLMSFDELLAGHILEIWLLAVPFLVIQEAVVHEIAARRIVLKSFFLYLVHELLVCFWITSDILRTDMVLLVYRNFRVIVFDKFGLGVLEEFI